MNHLRVYVKQSPRTACALAFGAITMAVQYFLWLPDARMSVLGGVLTIAAGLSHAVSGAITGPRLVGANGPVSLRRAGLLGAVTFLIALVLFTLSFTVFLFATEIHKSGSFTYVALPFLIAVFAFVGDGWALFLVSIGIGLAVHRIAASKQSA